MTEAAGTAVVVTRIPKKAKDDFYAFCQRRGTTGAERLRRFIAETLKEESPDAAREILDEEASDAVEVAARTTGGGLRLELRLRANEKRLVTQLANNDQVTIQQWFLARLVDAGLKRDGCFIHTAEARQLAQEIERCMRTLLGMANNLNQVARALNSTRTSGAKIAPERLVVLNAIEKELMTFVRRAHKVLDKLENPREKPLPKKNATPITRELCESIRVKLEAIIQDRSQAG